ncbi:MAG: hypothetical protein H0X65_14510, partial [Gemmatimonadetes bacterium]|nr:hypothetical protein [Gemmatimonadota bacterium]
ATALAGTVALDPPRDPLAAARSATLRIRSLAGVEVIRDLTFAQLHGEELRHLRATAAVVHGPAAEDALLTPTDLDPLRCAVHLAVVAAGAITHNR